MQAREAKEFILQVLVKLVGVSVLQFHLFVLGNHWPLTRHHVVHLLSVLDSRDQALTLNLLLKILKADFLNLIGVHRSLQVLLHLLSSLNRFRILRRITSLLGQELLVDIIRLVLNNWRLVLFIFSLILFVCTSSAPVSGVGKDDQDKEEDQGEEALPNFDLLVKKHDPEPDVGPQ